MKYSKKQILKAIKHWENVLNTMNESSNTDTIVIDLDCIMDKPYRGGKYDGQYTDAEFRKLVDKKAKKYSVHAHVQIPGLSVVEANVEVSGHVINVRKFVNDFYFGGTMTDEEWYEVLDMNDID